MAEDDDRPVRRVIHRLVQYVFPHADVESMRSWSRTYDKATFRRLGQPLMIGMIFASAVWAIVATILHPRIGTEVMIASWSAPLVGLAAVMSRRGAAVHVAAFHFAVVGIFVGRASAVSAIVVMAALSMVIALFSGRHRTKSVAALSLLSFCAPLWWQGLGALDLALVGGFATATTSMLVVVIASEAVQMAQTTEALFEKAPIGIMEQDWSATIVELDKLRRRGVTDVESYLRENPDEVGRLFSTARLLSANAKALEVLKPPPPDGHHSAAVVAETNFENFLAILVDLWAGILERTAIFPTIDAGGGLHWNRAVAFEHPDGKGRIIVASVDITELEEAKQALEELHVSKDRFIAAISHELRTPLAAVVGFSSELVERPELMDAEERDEALRVVSEQAMAAADIIADLLVAARADIGGVAVIHGAVDIETEINRILSTHPEHVSVSGADLLPAACADNGRIHQILRNLLANAIRYGGPERRVTCQSDDDTVAIEVRDDGQELGQIELESLFQPYTRAHESAGITESVGLGLTVARHLAEAMNGTLTAYRDGYETVFRLELPVWGRCPTANDSHASSIA